MILSLLNSDPHRCAFLDHLLLATKWVGVVGCGFGLTTLNELAPGLACMYKVADVLTQHAIYYQLYVNNKMLQGLRPERGMLKKVLFAASKTYQENNQSHPTR